ncbi:DNA internalization-related competence protein ComEC/Rec2 [Acetilactobacillus jinshanensis]|uniref:DNA internalization-related competence protein ComEC/Rec2 n=1 Tax=Acetilactobacillus jinshanensis TaxID=1720083 RepID=A0A4P6ZJS2_9LACO|nr:DNA internalization-related competence protein ComEC/Rec2 [Acetilactobacillus jinshanensis]
MIWVFRIYSLKIPNFLIKNLLMALIITGICGANVYVLHQRRLSPAKQTTQILKVYPDELQINENYVHGTGILIHPHQKILIHGVINSSAQLKELKTNHHAQLWQVNGDVDSIEKPTNVNQFDANRYYQSTGITNSLKINQIHKISNLEGIDLVNWIHSFRQRLISRAQNLPPSLKIYVLSLILGETDQESSPELSGIKQLGLIHLFSISGFHVYYLVGILEFILVHLRLTRERYRILIFGFLPIYYIFAGSSIGLLRSILMVEIGLLSRSMNFRISPLNVWSLALMANLMIAPQSLIQFGCQLSYVLSFALIFTRNYQFWKQTIFMNMVSFPFIIFNIYNWHVLTIAANLLILPLFSVIVFPVVIIGAIISHVSTVMGQLADLFLNFFDKFLNVISNLPGNIYFGKPNAGLVIIAFLITLLMVGKPSWRLIWTLFSLYLLMFTVIHFPLNGEVSYFDVGQGDSFLVRTPFNRSVTIIDTGGKLNFGHQPTNYQALRTSINYLNSRGIHTVDNLCLSHQDADHCGDVPAFLQKMNVKRLFIPLGMNKNIRFMNRIRPYMNRTQLIPVKNDDVIPQTTLKVVHPFTGGLGTNADSMVLHGLFGGKQWLFMGDLDKNGETDIIHHYPNLRTNVLKLGHHGSSTSTGQEFLARVNPQVAIISAGRHNRYHHPDPQIVQLVRRHGIKIFNTQNNGMITYNYHGNNGYWSTNN